MNFIDWKIKVLFTEEFEDTFREPELFKNGSYRTVCRIIRKFEDQFPSEIMEYMFINREKFEYNIKCMFANPILLKKDVATTLNSLCLFNKAYKFFPVNKFIPNPYDTRFFNISNKIFIRAPNKRYDSIDSLQLFSTDIIQLIMQYEYVQKTDIEEKVKALVKSYRHIFWIVFERSDSHGFEFVFTFYELVKAISVNSSKIYSKIDDAPLISYNARTRWNPYYLDEEYPNPLAAFQDLISLCSLEKALTHCSLCLNAEELGNLKLAISLIFDALGYNVFLDSIFNLTKFATARYDSVDSLRFPTVITQLIMEYVYRKKKVSVLAGSSLRNLKSALNREISKSFGVKNGILFILPMSPLFPGQAIVCANKSLSNHVAEIRLPESEHPTSPLPFSPEKFKQALQQRLIPNLSSDSEKPSPKQRALWFLQSELTQKLKEINETFTIGNAIQWLDAIYEYLFPINHALTETETLRREYTLSKDTLTNFYTLLNSSHPMFFVPTLKDHIDYLVRLLEPFCMKAPGQSIVLSNGVKISIDEKSRPYLAANDTDIKITLIRNRRELSKVIVHKKNRYVPLYSKENTISIPGVVFFSQKMKSIVKEPIAIANYRTGFHDSP